MKIAMAGFIGFSALSLCSCSMKSSRPSLNAPEPDPGTTASTAPVETSYIAIPISIPVSRLIDFNQIQGSIPKGENGNGAWWEIPHPGSGTGIKHRWRRMPFAISASGRTVHASTMIVYQLKLGVNIANRSFRTIGSCGYDGDPWKRVAVKLQSTLDVGGDYRVLSSTTIDADFQDPCLMTVANIDATPYIKAKFKGRLPGIAADIDTRIPALLNFKDQASEAWNNLMQPIPIGSNPEAWLTINPVAVSVSTPNIDSDILHFTAYFTANPQVAVGAPTSAGNIPLPALGKTVPGNGFHIALKGSFPHEEAQNILSKELDGRQYEFIKGRKVTIESTRLYGNGFKTIVQLNLSGDFNGCIFLSGKPHYEAGSHELSIPDLDYDIKTSDWLVTVADWLKHEEFVKSIRARAKWNVSGRIASLRGDIDSKLNRRLSGRITMTGNLKALRPLGVHSTGSAFEIVTIADGDVQLSMN